MIDNKTINKITINIFINLLLKVTVFVSLEDSQNHFE